MTSENGLLVFDLEVRLSFSSVPELQKATIRFKGVLLPRSWKGATWKEVYGPGTFLLARGRHYLSSFQDPIL